MRHGLLATDAEVISPTHNYTHQQHLFCMDDSQLQIQISPLCLHSDTESTNSTHIPSNSFWHKANSFHRIHLILSQFLFLLFSHILSVTCQLARTYPPTLNFSCFPFHILSFRAFLFPLISVSPHPAPQSLGLIGIRHAVGDKVWPTRCSVILAHRHCPMSQHRHTPSNPPARFVPPALWPHSKQSPGQVLHA